MLTKTGSVVLNLKSKPVPSARKLLMGRGVKVMDDEPSIT